MDINRINLSPSERAEHMQNCKCFICVKVASLVQTHSFLPASWAGDTHEETDVLPIGDQEEMDRRLLNCRTDSLRNDASTYDEVLCQAMTFLRNEGRRVDRIASDDQGQT